MSLPRNKKLLKAIQQIVLNVYLKYYGKSPLDITGPIMFGKLFPYEYKKNSKVENESRFQSLCRLNLKPRSGMKPVPAAKPEFVFSKRRRVTGAPKAISLESIGANNYFYDNFNVNFTNIL